MLYNSHFFLLDSACMDDEIETAKVMNSVYDSLYRGSSQEELASVAPYLFQVHRESEMFSWYLAKGWGDSWGVVVIAQEDMKSLHKHFRKFLMVQTEDGEELYFRFYDPRVLRIFLPTCDKGQLQEFFGPVSAYICEDEDPAFGLVFTFQDGALRQQRLTKEEAMRFEPEEKRRRFSLF